VEEVSPALVVSDTSPIRALHHLGLLPLLPVLFSQVMVPPAVASELATPPARFVPIDVSAIGAFTIQAPGDRATVANLRQNLGAGESEAIVLALEIRADLLIDDANGREEAIRRGLHVTGLAGVLLAAKANGAIADVIPLLLRLRTGLGFLLSDRFLSEVARQCGEQYPPSTP
jgi:uncharacterized protein